MKTKVKKKLDVVFEQDVVEQIERIAVATDRSRGAVVRTLVKQALCSLAEDNDPVEPLKIAKKMVIDQIATITKRSEPIEQPVEPTQPKPKDDVEVLNFIETQDFKNLRSASKLKNDDYDLACGLLKYNKKNKSYPNFGSPTFSINAFKQYYIN